MLTIPALSDKFAVFTDASSCGVGGVLCVCRDDVWVPCAYYSRQLLPREQRYAATELEALAMLTAIEHFSYYLLCTDFVVYSDHKALLHLFSSPVLNNRLWRWQLRLSDYNFTVIHVAGKMNCIADALSRQGWPDGADKQKSQ